MNGTVRVTDASHLHNFEGTRGNVSLLASLGIGTAIGVAVAALFWVAKFAVPYFYEVHYHRGVIPFITTELTGIGLAILWLKSRHLRRERSMFQMDYLKRIVGELPAGDNAELSVEQSDADQYILPSRVAKALKVLRKTSSIAEVNVALTDAATLDNDLLSSSYYLVNFLVWMIPLLGIIGTVVGVSAAVGEFQSIMGAQGESVMETIRSHIGSISGGLALAFDTTLQALTFAAILKLASSFLLKMDEDFLSGVEKYCAEKLVPALRHLGESTGPETPGGPQTAQVFQAMLTALARIESRMGTGLPPEIGQVLDEIAKELRSAKDVFTAASSLKQVLGDLSQALKTLQEPLVAIKTLPTQIDGLAKLGAEIFGRQWPSRT
jgi:biopolymer transport protein ExbB/TolQ